MDIREIKWVVDEAIERINAAANAASKSVYRLLEFGNEVWDWEDNTDNNIPGKELLDIADSWVRLSQSYAEGAKASLAKIEWPEADDDAVTKAYKAAFGDDDDNDD